MYSFLCLQVNEPIKMPGLPTIVSGVIFPPPRSTITTTTTATGKIHTPPQMDEDDLPAQLMIAEDRMDTSDEQSRISKQKLMDTLSFSFPAGSLAQALNKVCYLLMLSMFSRLVICKICMPSTL